MSENQVKDQQIVLRAEHLGKRYKSRWVVNDVSLEVKSGEILIDGEPFSSINKSAWKNIVAYIPQEPYLFHDTIMANILWGNPKATDTDVWEVLELIEAFEFIKRLPKGLDTVVGDRGEQLSGGERQRVILARALIKKPKVLILDEATSSLDTINERKIMEEIYNTAENITLIIVTNRHKSVSRCDKVYLLDNGKIIDEGKFADLEKRHSF